MTHRFCFVMAWVMVVRERGKTRLMADLSFRKFYFKNSGRGISKIFWMHEKFSRTHRDHFYRTKDLRFWTVKLLRSAHVEFGWNDHREEAPQFTIRRRTPLYHQSSSWIFRFHSISSKLQLNKLETKNDVNCWLKQKLSNLNLPSKIKYQVIKMRFFILLLSFYEINAGRYEEGIHWPELGEHACH